MNTHFFPGCFRILLSVALVVGGVESANQGMDGESEGQLLQFLLVVSSASEFNTSGVIPAVDLALEAVNNLSQSFSLSYNTTLDSQCDYEYSMQKLQGELRQASPSLVAVIGCGCSTATEALVDVPELKMMPVISYASSSPVLSDGEKYPSVFRTIPSTSDIPEALAAFVHLFGWQQVAVFTQELSASAEILNSTLFRNGITAIMHIISSSHHNKSQISLQNAEERIFVLDVNTSIARYLLCEASQSRLYYPGYAWLIVNNFAQWEWWELKSSGGSDTVNCTQDQLEKALNYSVLVTPASVDSEINNREMPPNVLEMELEETEMQSRFSGYAIDSIWAIFLALNVTLTGMSPAFPEINSSSSSSTGSSSLFPEIISHLQTLEFNGVTGRVGFDNNGDRVNTTVRFTQLRTTENGVLKIVIATHDDGGLTLADGESNKTIWPAGVPTDGIPTTTIVSVSYAVLSIVVLYSLLGMAFSLVCFVFNLRFQNVRIIRLSSPNLNNLIIVGGTLIYAILVPFSVPVKTESEARIVCSVRVFVTVVIGYDICLAVALVKMGRVYYIFKNPGLKKKVVRDWHLILVVFLILIPDVICNVITSTTYAIFFTPELRLSKENPSTVNQSTGEVQEFSYLSCEGDVSLIINECFTVTYKFCLHAAAIVLAFLTRNVKTTGLNDYKYNILIVYISSALLLVMGVTTAFLRDFVNTYAFLVPTSLFSVGTVFLAFTFVPKMINLHKDPKGERVFSIATMKRDIQKSLNSSVTNCKTNVSFTAGFRRSISHAPPNIEGKGQSRRSNTNLLPEIVTTAPGDIGVTPNGSICTSPRLSGINLPPVTPEPSTSPECLPDSKTINNSDRTS